jgi:hypothetical protein
LVVVPRKDLVASLVAASNQVAALASSAAY